MHTPPSSQRDSHHQTSLANLIFHARRVHTTTIQRTDANTYDEITERVWEIPFTVDHSLQLADITQRIDTVMDKLALYTSWHICYNLYIISATEHIMLGSEL
jgi:hypothetical protein